MPARAFRLDNFTFSNLLLNEAHPSDTGDLETSRTSTRASQTTTSPFLARRGLPVRHGDLETSRTLARAYRSVKLIFSILRPAKAYPTTLPVDCEAFRPLNFTLLSKPVHSVSPDIPTDAGESTPGQTTFSFQVLRSSMLTVRHGDLETSRTRASQLDNLSFSSPTLGEAYPSDTAIIETTVGRWQEPPSQTILPSMSHARRGLPVRLGDYQSQRGLEPPSQTTHLFRQLAPPFEPRRTLHTRPSNNLRFQSTTGEVPPPDPRVSISCRKVIRASRLDNLTFSSYVSEANPSNRWACPPVGCRLSIPTILYLSVFTCPTQWASISRRSPARAFPARQPCLF